MVIRSILSVGRAGGFPLIIAPYRQERDTGELFTGRPCARFTQETGPLRACLFFVTIASR
jgi:hypothetical protein